MATNELHADLDEFSIEQRRRAEALVLVHELYPTLAASTVCAIARWVTAAAYPGGFP
jgi:hypothetical protein